MQGDVVQAPNRSWLRQSAQDGPKTPLRILDWIFKALANQTQVDPHYASPITRLESS